MVTLPRRERAVHAGAIGIDRSLQGSAEIAEHMENDALTPAEIVVLQPA